MMGRSYIPDEKVLVESGVFIASPDRSEPSIPCTVVRASPKWDTQVYLCRDNNHDCLYVFKERIAP